MGGLNQDTTSVISEEDWVLIELIKYLTNLGHSVVQLPLRRACALAHSVNFQEEPLVSAPYTLAY